MDKKPLFIRIISGFILIAFFLLGTIVTDVSAYDSPSSSSHGKIWASSHSNFGIRAGTSLNWSGYVAESNTSNPTNGFVNAVKGNWIVPTLAANPSGENTCVAIWVGIDGYSDNTVEQVGTEQEIVNGVQQNYAWVEMYPQPSQMLFTVNNGDSITASVTFIGGIMFTLSISDLTTGQSFSHNYSANAHRRSADWIVEAPYSDGILPLANFGTTKFDNAQFTDNTSAKYAIDGGGAGTYAITMINPGGETATPSVLTDNGETSSFSVVYGPYGVDVSISPDNRSGQPGEKLAYTITIKNVGNAEDNYNLTVSDNADWGPTLDNNVFENLLQGENVTTTLRVAIPDNASPNTNDNITVIVTSQGDPSVHENSSCLAFITERALNLIQGWNFVCFQVDNGPTTPDRVFMGENYYTDYYLYTWTAPNGPYVLVGPDDVLQDNLGYLTYIKENTSLAWSGTQPASRDVYMVSGWNMVGFPVVSETATPDNIFAALVYYTDYYLFTWTAPEGPYNLQDPFTVLLDNVGYWVWINQDKMITVP
jgi:uncharacterized repeat protein (TIGR01451 family)